MKRVFLIVLDSFGVGEMPDAAEYKDEGSNTLASCATSPYLNLPNMRKLGLYRLANREETGEPELLGACARMKEASRGKDTTIGHWEIAGLVSNRPMPTFPNGFPQKLVELLEKETGRTMLCNRTYSGTEVIRDYGTEQVDTGALILYTSADSVMQIAAHEAVVPVKELYRYCEIARKLCAGEYAVGRVIARPFIGEKGNYIRTTNRHDFSLEPPTDTMLDVLKQDQKAVIAIGKIHDIFAGRGTTFFKRTKGNEEGIHDTLTYLREDFEGLCFVNLVDFDMLYGHRNDIEGYAKALTAFDEKLPEIIAEMKEEDILMITADHGCDPGTPSTDHSREYTPLLIYGPAIKSGVNLGTRQSFADISATILDYFGEKKKLAGESFLPLILK